MSGRHRRCVSDSSRYIRSRAQYAASRLALVKVDLPKGTGGLTGHHHSSLSHAVLLAAWDARLTRKRPRAGLYSRTVRLFVYFSARRQVFSVLDFCNFSPHRSRGLNFSREQRAARGTRFLFLATPTAEVTASKIEANPRTSSALTHSASAVVSRAHTYLP